MSDDPYIQPEELPDFLNIPQGVDEEVTLPWGP